MDLQLILTAGTTVLEINRYTSDGVLIEFRQDNVTEGSFPAPPSLTTVLT
jgi:hypothetical protein